MTPSAASPRLLRPAPLTASLRTLTALVLVLTGCSQAPAAKADPSPVFRIPGVDRSKLGGTGVTASGTATFQAERVDVNTWSGATSGTGQFSLGFQPPLTGGPAAIAGEASDGGGTVHFLLLGNFQGSPGVGLGVVSATPFAVGTVLLDGVNAYVEVLDLATGDTLAYSDAATLTLTAVGAGLGSFVSGSLTGTFERVSTGCTSDAECRPGSTCQSGACVVTPPPLCTSDADCAAGQTCQAGRCAGSTPQPPRSCLGLSGQGSFAAQLGAPATCSALTASLNLAPAAVELASMDPFPGPSLYFYDSTGATPTWARVELKSCPTAAATLQLGVDAEAYLYVQSAAGPDVELFGTYRATGGSVTFTQVGSGLQGSATLSFPGGTGSATFNLQ